MKNEFISPRSARRVVDMPEWYGGGWDLVTGRKIASGKYARSPWAFACMQIRGAELAGLPWRITKDGKEIDHAMVEMLTNFGKESNYSEAIMATEIDLLRTGAAYWLQDADILERLNAGTITIETDGGGIKKFIQTIDGKVTNKFDREEIIYFREYHPDTDLEPGTAVMEVIKLAVAQEYEASRYVEAFFKNDATPSLLLTTDQVIAQPEMDKIRGWWNKTFRGARKAHKVGMADRGLKAQVLSTSMRDIALVEIRDQARGDICTAMRVPKLLVGSMADATYANAQEARKFMIEDLIIPRSRYFEDVINADLAKRLDPSIRFEFVTDKLPILQENATSKWARMSSAIHAGVISPEFARGEMGWPETAAPAEAPAAEEVDPDLRSWKRKALKAIGRGNSADVEFETNRISLPEQLRIHDRLADATTAEAVTRAFLDD